MNKKQAKKIVEWCNNSILMKNLSAKDYGTSYTKEKIDEAFCSLSPKYKKGFTKEKKKLERISLVSEQLGALIRKKIDRQILDILKSGKAKQ